MHAVVVGRAIPEHVHGYLSRFLSEIDSGIYVGVVSPKVVDRLWERCIDAAGTGTLILITSAAEHEQGFTVKTHGTSGRRVEDHDGIWLAARVTSEDRINPTE